MSQTTERGRTDAPADQKSTSRDGADVHRAAPAGADCGTIVTIDDVLQLSPDRLPTKNDGTFCRVPARVTRIVQFEGCGIEIAVCERHMQSLQGQVRPVVR